MFADDGGGIHGGGGGVDLLELLVLALQTKVTVVLL